MAVFAAALAACRGGAVRAPIGSSAPVADITLYRDAAVVRQTVELDAAGPAPVAITVELPATAVDIAVVDDGGLAIGAVHVAMPDLASRTQPADSAGAAVREAPLRVAIEVAAPRAGHYAFALHYMTTQLAWTAAYALTTSPAHASAVLDGALAIANTTGLAFPAAQLAIIDAPLGGARVLAGEALATALTGAQASTTPAATRRALGGFALGRGANRVAFAGISAPEELRSVLVYDPVGTALDNPGALPSREPGLGVNAPAPSQVQESVEVTRDEAATRGLPAGPVALYERGDSGDGGNAGALRLLGQARLFDDATRVAPVDTIPIGTAKDVSASRRRLDYSVEDDVRHRLTEEFLITVDNRRAAPAEVLVREHLYRGETWTIAYESTKRPAKEGAQQIALRADVPANGKAEITYVVVYSWKP